MEQIFDFQLLNNKLCLKTSRNADLLEQIKVLSSMLATPQILEPTEQILVKTKLFNAIKKLK